MRRIVVLTLMLATVLASTNAWAQTDRSSDCINLVKTCLAMFRDKGPEYALKAIDSKSVFIDKELYIFALNMNNVMLAHPYKSEWKGLNMTSKIDANNKAYLKEMSTVAEKAGDGWVEYSWLRRGEDKARLKRTYIAKVPSQNIYIGAGYYPTTDATSPPPESSPVASRSDAK